MIQNYNIQYQQQMLKIVDNYTLTDYLGKGEYGKVYKAVNIDTKFDVAIKMIPLSKFEDISKLAELTKNELRILKLLEDNINVINFVEMIKTNRNIYLVYQFCEGGTLEDLIRNKGHLPEKQALRVFKQLLSAFKSLHSHNILHRDIKPDNIFFKSGHLKLADFGFCKQLKNTDDLTQTSLGSPLYMAPEVLNGDVYGSKADIWSLGIVLYEMLFGKCPFGQCNIKQLVNVYQGEKVKIPMSDGEIFISPTTENMLRRMLEKDQFKRISWEDFFYEYDIDEYGSIIKKQKDFEYDLMKLMKRNSSKISSQSQKIISLVKVDWTKITDKNSSVHSQQLNHMQNMNNQSINEIYSLKKKVKQFECEHQKRVELSSIIEQLLNQSEPEYYSTTICYFLLFNMQKLIDENLVELQSFAADNRQLLSKNPNESDCVNKMTVVFRNQAQNLKTRINSLKITLVNSQGFQYNILKYPQQSVLIKQVKKYVDKFKQKNQGILNFGMIGYVGNRDKPIFLIKVLWGIALIKDLRQNKGLNMLGIKEDTSLKDLSIMLNKIIVLLYS